jgi:outer membrane receptor protein involved in Fe transport
VGSDTDVPPYSNNLFYSINPSLFPNATGSGQPIAGINASVIPNPDLRPMHVTEREIGLEMRLFDNRIGFEASYYNKLSSDQILQAQISDASGYLTQLINVGESRNKGVEMVINGSPVSGKNFSWNVNFNAAYNTSEVLTLGTSISDSTITVGTGEFMGELRQVVGKPIGQLYGWGYLRDENGTQIFDAGNGRALRTPRQIAFGSAVPVWTGGITNTFNYKGINLSFLVDFKLGNKMISGTNYNAWRHGLHKGTLGRQGGRFCNWKWR